MSEPFEVGESVVGRERIPPPRSRKLISGGLTLSGEEEKGNMIGFIILGGVFALAGIACFFRPAELWRSEVRRHHPVDEDDVEPSERALLDMQVRGIICFLIGLGMISSPFWLK
jgi:hypothetical protein